MTETGQSVHIRRLEPRGDRSGFHSGSIDLDRCLQRYAGQNRFRHHIGTTYVAVHTERVAGFVSVSSGEMAVEHLSKALRKGLPSYPLPVRLIATAVGEQRGPAR